MNCSNCGRNNNIENKFCEQCGLELNNNINQNINNYNVVNDQSNSYTIDSNQNNNIINNIQNANYIVNDSQNNINDNVNSPKKKNGCGCGCGCFIVLIIFILLIIGLITLILSFTKSNKEVINYEYPKEYKYLAISNSGDYVINDAPTDITFYVTTDSNYTVTDSSGNVVNTIIENNKIVNTSEYKKGETYKITLNNGSFVSSQLENTKSVTFEIKKDEVKEYEFKENVIKEKKLKFNNDKTSFTSNKKYNLNDVIIIEDNKKISEAYIITSISGNNYNIRKAQLNEIYSKLNYYYEEYADLSDYKVMNQLKEYIAYDVENSPWYASIVETVHAEPTIEIDFNEIENGLEAIINLKIAADEDSFILNPKHHDIEITLTEKLIVSQLIDVTLDNWDVSLDITSDSKFELEITNQVLDYESVVTKKATEEILEKIKNAIQNSEYKDTDEKEGEIATILIPTSVPCLNVTLDFKLINSISASTKLDYDMSQTINVVVGFDAGINEDFEFVGSYEKDYSNMSILYAGNIEEKIGVEFSVGLELLNTISVSADISGGMYASADLEVNIASSYETIAKVEGGIFIDAGISAQVLTEEFDYTLVEQKWKLFEKEWKHNYSEEITDEDNQETSSENSLEQTNRLENYTCVDSLEDNTYIKYKYKYQNGNFAGIEMVGTYYYKTGYDWLDELIKLLIRIMTIFMNIEYGVPAYYYEDDNYSYVIIYMTEDLYYQEFDTNDLNYNSFKLKMEQDGYYCK